MDSTRVRLLAALLALVATCSTLASIAFLANVESRPGMPVVRLPEVVVLASKSAAPADSSTAGLDAPTLNVDSGL